ncbi:MAG: ferritin-like domain-containing protein [Alphaproteobacteria bacterium]|nr:ferritin-like domain-containing protein [Alphaproteobacteria bacterium]
MQRTLHPWTIDTLPWGAFDAETVNPDLLKIVKAAALVEYNAGDYASYLCNVFADDAAFCHDVKAWAREETQHGAALGAWAMRADPSFDFENAAARYRAGYRINVDAAASIRGSKSGELIARCIVETGTSSYYTALGDASDEPVLKALCRHIAADELRHYKLFFSHLKRYNDRDGLTRLQKLKIGLGRVQESEDDELAYAYYIANAPAGAAYDRLPYTMAYMARAYPLYRPDNIERIVAMVFRACGITLSSFTRTLIKHAAALAMKIKMRQARMLAASI